MPPTVIGGSDLAPPASSMGSAASASSGGQEALNVTVACGSCGQLVSIQADAGGACRYSCPSCGKLNEFRVAGAPSRDIQVRYPAYWTTQSADGRLFTNESEEVKQAVQAMLDKTWKNQWTRDRGRDGKVQRYEVVMVQRNENPAIWQDYYRQREQLKEQLQYAGVERYEAKTATLTTDVPEAKALVERGQLCREVNEFYLFHGTKPSAAKAICDDDFLVKMAGSNAGTLYGPGLYFAEASSKSDEYASDDTDGIFSGLYGMIVCRVTCGNINYSDQVAPPVQSLVDSVMREKTHHAILGDREKCRGTYREFIIFDKNQVYPEYVVVYKRVDK